MATSDADFQHNQGEGRLDGKGGAGVFDADGAREEIGATAGEVHERIGNLAAIVVQELQKGVHIGSIAAARAQAIRR